MPRQVLACLFAAIALAACWAEITRTAWAEEPYGRFQFDASDRNHWAYLPVKRPTIPAVSKADWVKNPVDAFVLHELEAKGLSPSSPSERGALLRRVYFDLIGLPPTPAEQDAFLADTSPDAYAKV